jgi:hypothetical protein
MYKEIYLLRGKSAESYESFISGVTGICTEILEKTGPVGLKITYTAIKPPAISVIPFRKDKIATISVYREKADTTDIIRRSDGFAGVFSVKEELPVKYDKTWADGEATPGVGLLTLFHQKKGISYETFLKRWHGSHTPLSLKLHPLWNYSRNVVLEKLTDGAAWYDGIVEEHVRQESDLLNPFRFFGKPWVILYNMLLVYRDTKSFIDYKRIETYLVKEIVFKDPFTSSTKKSG